MGIGAGSRLPCHTAPTTAPENRESNDMETPLTPLRFIQRAASVHPDRTAIIDGQRTFTDAAMAADVNRLANALIAEGLRGGDRVTYLAPNCAEVLIGHFAVPDPATQTPPCRPRFPVSADDTWRASARPTASASPTPLRPNSSAE